MSPKIANPHMKSNISGILAVLTKFAFVFIILANTITYNILTTPSIKKIVVLEINLNKHLSRFIAKTTVILVWREYSLDMLLIPYPKRVHQIKV